MNLKRIIREEIDDMGWINDIKSNQDIAQEIADKTDIKDNEIDTPFTTKKIPNVFSLSPLFSTYRYFNAYCENYYGLTDVETTHDIWKRYKDIIMNKINNLNESDDLDWIRDQNPPILKSLTNVTIDNDNINVTWDNGNFENIEDVNGHEYFTEDDLGEFLGCENDWDESIKNITKEKLLLFLKDNIEGSWTFDKCEKGWKDKTGGGVEDCLDFMKLYRLIEKL